jgi:hypothetical protein
MSPAPPLGQLPLAPPLAAPWPAWLHLHGCLLLPDPSCSVPRSSSSMSLSLLATAHGAIPARAPPPGASSPRSNWMREAGDRGRLATDELVEGSWRPGRQGWGARGDAGNRRIAFGPVVLLLARFQRGSTHALSCREQLFGRAVSSSWSRTNWTPRERRTGQLHSIRSNKLEGQFGHCMWAGANHKLPK